MKALKTLVIALAILIAAGIAVLVWGMTRIAHPSLQAASTAPAAALVPAAAPVELAPPPGMHFEQMLAVGDRLAIRFAGPGGQRILLVDPHGGRVDGTLAVPGSPP